MTAIDSDSESVDERNQAGSSAAPLLSLDTRKPRLFRSLVERQEIKNGRVDYPLLTLRELKMLEIMDQITDQENWFEDVKDDETVARWAGEILDLEEGTVSEKMVDYIIAELRYKADIFKKTGAVAIYNGDVVKSDGSVSEEIRLNMLQEVSPLENVLSRNIDYRPGAGERVVDLVRPSHHSVVGPMRTRMIPETHPDLGLDDCFSRLSEATAEIPLHYSLSQWLPCEVGFDSGKARIRSYINNLHPVRYRALYGLIEQVIDSAVPAWNLALAPVDSWDTVWKERVRIRYEGKPDLMEVQQPEPGVFKHLEDGSQFLNLDQGIPGIIDRLKESGLQVVVQLTNIELKPSKSNFFGEIWHAAGNAADAVCAVACYCYSMENITDSRIAFRQRSDTSSISQFKHPHDFFDYLPIVFGCDRFKPAVQEVGDIDIRQGRIVAFPNTIQSKLLPFNLKDRTKPGHLKMLILYLVDPHRSLVSSARVLPQQRQWWLEHALQEAERAGDGSTGDVPFAHLLENAEDSEEEEEFNPLGSSQGIFPLSTQDIKRWEKRQSDARRTDDIELEQLFEGSRFDSGLKGPHGWRILGPPDYEDRSLYSLQSEAPPPNPFR